MKSRRFSASNRIQLPQARPPREDIECARIKLRGLILARCGWTALLTMRGEFARWGDRMNLGRWHERRFDVCRDQRNWRPCVGILVCSVARHCDPEPDNCDGFSDSVAGPKF